tara:strand:+ start:3675 stop:4463 length:789 start_codon:yes stop_codon:yes gene_type:complete
MRSLLEPTQIRVKNLQWALHLSIFPALYFGTWQYCVLSLIVFWLIHGIGSGIGTHRYYVHRTFETNRYWQIIFSFLFTISTSGSTIGYTLVHLKHHAHSDKEHDPHSPANGFLRAWLGMYSKSSLTLSPKIFMRLMKDPIMKFFHKFYFGIILFYIIILGLINPLLIIFMWAIPAVAQFHANAILIALVHDHRIKYLGGYRSCATSDDSYNIWWLKPLLLGEELHNNHHAKPASVTTNLGNGWRDFDPLFYIIKYIIRGKIK